MKVSCLQENLARALSVVGRAIPTRTTLPITQNFKLNTEQSMLRISATDLEVAMSIRIGAQVHEEGEITVPARLFSEFVGRLPDDRLDMEVTDQPLGLNVKCTSSESNFNGLPADDYPLIPYPQDGVKGRIESATLKDAINHVAFSAAVEDSRPVLTGVKTEIEGDDFKLAAADGFRLAVYSGKIAEALEDNLDFLMPARALNEISRLLPQQNERIDFEVDKSDENQARAMFRIDSVEVVSMLIQGSFPNYNQLIPESHTTRVEMRSLDFIRATRAADIFARDASNIVRLQINGKEGEVVGEVNVSARAEEIGNYAGSLPARINGEDAKIAFSSKYLTEVLDVLSNGEVALEISSPSSPGVIKPVEGDNYVHVVMPMFVQW